jgi:hypothetical protein
MGVLLAPRLIEAWATSASSLQTEPMSEKYARQEILSGKKRNALAVISVAKRDNGGGKTLSYSQYY